MSMTLKKIVSNKLGAILSLFEDFEFYQIQKCKIFICTLILVINMYFQINANQVVEQNWGNYYLPNQEKSCLLTEAYPNDCFYYTCVLEII